ncbi:MFS transporter [Neptuniibacter sp.]|uniref:MFS transporter n=1 Tax=Neptuniibacter sp. TaxID=1962643 RepID=UPI00262317B2|nr:MFS transporter [Neptuniibacter sp.]MCP4595840.1 MFS transporter [Neptuniibacter sp.]
MITRPKHILPCIVLAQLLGTSTWFAGNAILPILQSEWSLPDSAVAPLTNSVQFGFIVGALLFSLLALADRISPRILFFICSLGNALFNVLIVLWADSFDTFLVLRFMSGVMLAGVYPVGMKIATGWYPEGLGRALGFLVGALAVGTASAHFFSSLNLSGWQPVIYLVSLAALCGGLLVLLFVPDGPALHKGKALKFKELLVALRHKPLRASAGGYFGHMWELYAVLALVPYWLLAWQDQHGTEINISFWSFVIIAMGGLGCVTGGFWSGRVGSRIVAQTMLVLSGLCCLLSPLAMQFSFGLMLLFWCVWGFTVVADSPQFSALSAQTAPKEVVGSALTMINSIGFTITMVAVQVTALMLNVIPVEWIMLFLAPGPVLGICSLIWLKRLQQDMEEK